MMPYTSTRDPDCQVNFFFFDGNKFVQSTGHTRKYP